MSGAYLKVDVYSFVWSQATNLPRALLVILSATRGHEADCGSLLHHHGAAVTGIAAVLRRVLIDVDREGTRVAREPLDVDEVRARDGARPLDEAVEAARGSGSDLCPDGRLRPCLCFFLL